MEADYTYASAGRTSTMSNPAGGYYYYDASNNPVYIPDTFTYSSDTMGRPSGLTASFAPGSWVWNVQYDYAGRMTGMSSVSGGPNVPQTWNYTSGFDPQCQTTNGDTTDQTHHFAAFFELGYKPGAVVPTGANELRELIEGAWGNLTGGVGYNEGDVLLGMHAAAIGGALKNKAIKPGDVSFIVQSQLCGGH